MSDEIEKFEIRLDGSPAKTAFVCVPIALYADDQENGMALLHGKMREAQAHLAKLIIEIRKRRVAIQPGVILPNGAPAYPQ